jgi:hypothetical protein
MAYSLHIKPFWPREVAQEIKNISPHKPPGYDLIAGKVPDSYQDGH